LNENRHICILEDMKHNIEVEVEQESGVYVVSIKGQIDAVTVPIIESKLSKLYGVATKLVLNFSDVDYLSSAGIRLILQTAKRMDSKGGGIAIYGMIDDVFEIIQMAGFDRILNFYKSKLEAIKSLR